MQKVGTQRPQVKNTVIFFCLLIHTVTVLRRFQPLVFFIVDSNPDLAVANKVSKSTKFSTSEMIW
jgi:hypothetical protein